jgi:hypothetical protein
LAQLYGEHAKKDVKQRGLALAEINLQMSQMKNAPPMQSVQALGTYAWVLCNLDEWKKAQNVMSQIEKATSLPPDCAFYQARLLKHDGQGEDALKLLNGALKSGRFFVHRKEAEDMAASLSGETNTSKKEKKKDGDSGNAGAGANGATPPAATPTPEKK